MCVLYVRVLCATDRLTALFILEIIFWGKLLMSWTHFCHDDRNYYNNIMLKKHKMLVITSCCSFSLDYIIFYYRSRRFPNFILFNIFNTYSFKSFQNAARCAFRRDFEKSLLSTKWFDLFKHQLSVCVCVRTYNIYVCFSLSQHMLLA